jgi:hypothetical protein
MRTQTQTKTASSLNANLMDLPILKHFNESEITTKVDSFRKGEKGMFSFFKLAVLGGILYGGYKALTIVLPPMLEKLGEFLGYVSVGIAAVVLFIMVPVIFKGIRMLTRALHKTLIRWDPFAQLEIERQKMIANQTTFRIAKQNIAQLKNDMEIEASRAQTDAEEGHKNITRLQAKGQKIKDRMEELVKAGGVEARGEDEYVNLAAEFQKVNAEALRVINKTTQSKEFVQKYGTRANIMKKMGHKLTMVETSMDIKISDFDATVEMLKKDYDFAQKSNAATSAAKNAMGFSKGWEFDVALETITNTIAADTAMTAGNLRDIESLTTNYTLDSDELFANLNAVADKIKVGEDVIPTAKQYNNPEYVLTTSDRQNSGGFGDLF